jgi:hypothetical protein
MKSLAFFAAAVAFCGAVSGAERQSDPPLVVNGDLSLTTADFEAYVQYTVPEKLRSDFRANVERIKPTVDSLWVFRVLAQKARESGVADDPIVAARARQAADKALAEAYVLEMEKKLKFPDFTARAREIYATRPDDFRNPEQVHVEHILVAVSECRNDEQARLRANEILARVRNADEKTFLEEAKKSSDDRAVKKNGGDLGLVPASSFEGSFAEAVAKMKQPGEIVGPVETRFGYHIVRFVAREPGKLKPFDEVKDGLIAAERQKAIDKFREEQLTLARNAPGNHVYIENVEALTKAAKP